MKNRLLHAAFTQNPASVQLLGLCPLLAVSNTLISGLGLALASAFVVIGSNTIISCIRAWIPDVARLPVFVLIIATFTTVAVLLLEAFAYGLYLKIALFVQIIVTNCMILGRAEQFASRQPVWPSILDATGTACGFAIALLVLGTIREAIGQASLLSGADALFGTSAADWTVQLGEVAWFPLAQFPPGAFLVAGLLLALLTWLNERRKKTSNIHSA